MAFGRAISRPVGLPLLVPLDLAAGRVGRVLACSRHARSAARFRSARSYRCRTNTGVSGAAGVDLVEGRHPPLGELELGPAAHDAHPLRRRGAPRLLLEHAQGVGQRRHAVPAQLHVVVEPAPDQVQVRIVQAGDDRPPARVDDLRAVAPELEYLVAGTYGDELAVQRRRPLLPPDCVRRAW